MNTTEDDPPAAASAPPSHAKRNAFVLLVIACLAGCGAWLSLGRGGMGELSPYTLQRRWRTEYTLGSGSLPIYRSAYQYGSSDVIAFLLDEKIVEPVVDPGDDRWETLFHWNDAWRDGFGGLYDEFCRTQDGTIEWCKQDRDRARYYYGELFRFLRSEHEEDQWTAYQMARLRRSGIESIEGLKKAIAVTRYGALYELVWAIEHGDRRASAAEHQRLKKELAHLQSEWKFAD